MTTAPAQSSVNGPYQDHPSPQPRHSLQTLPSVNRSKGNIPNTPLAASTISFLLGSVFSLGLYTFLIGGLNGSWWGTYQLGFFVAAWAAFHWAEFAVTAGWNLEKCSVDSFLLDNGVMYHIANGTAVAEYLITIFFKPSFKANAYFTPIGISRALILTSISHPKLRDLLGFCGANPPFCCNDSCFNQFLTHRRLYQTGQSQAGY
ncbi:hypothetical protein AX16_001035 [Volvariella volvacea WC 439]|nr:hypothetical protein AX16_001035 [Volvariella volvacea WC 439]